MDGSERDEWGSARDRAADERDARDRARDVAAAARDAAADARDDSSRRRERFARDLLWADNVHAEAGAQQREPHRPEAIHEARLEQALLDGEMARSRAALICQDFRRLLDEMRQQRLEAEADRRASRQDRMQSGFSRHQAAQDRQAAAQDRFAAAVERDHADMAHASAMPAGRQTNQAPH